MGKTLTQAIHDNQHADETMTECVHREAQAGETMTQCMARLAKSGGTQPPVVTKPAKPGALTETGVTKTEIQLDWAQVADAANYNIDITPTVTGYPKDISVNTLALTGLTAATAYTIKVKACNTAGCSAVTQKTVTTAT